MLKKVNRLLKEVDGFVPKNKDELESFRLSFLGKKGYLNSLFYDFKKLPVESKKDLGKKINQLKKQLKILLKNITLILYLKKNNRLLI